MGKEGTEGREQEGKKCKSAKRCVVLLAKEPEHHQDTLATLSFG